jgi:Domain of unknown function (DUF4326)
MQAWAMPRRSPPLSGALAMSDTLPRPVRLRLSRAKGFNLQGYSMAVNGLPAVNVARPGLWGNPFVVGQTDNLGRGPMDNVGAVGMFEDMLRDPGMIAAYGYPASGISSLAGRNLACWCKDGPCHADVLLELANGFKCEVVL